MGLEQCTEHTPTVQTNKSESAIKELKRSDSNAPHYRLFPSTRLFIVFLTLLVSFSCSLTTSNIGFAFVCMVNSTGVQQEQHSDSAQKNATCGGKRFIVEGNDYTGSFLWDKTVQSHLVAARTWGTLILLIPAGQLVDRYGLKLIYTVILFVATLTTALHPVAANLGYWYLFGLRIIMGAFTGITWAGTYSLCSRWIPKKELGLLLAVLGLGWPFGNSICMIMSGLLCASSWGWPAIFYCQAAISATALTLWVILYKDDPAKVPFISEHELAYIEGHRTARKRDKTYTPWRRVIVSPAALAPIFGSAGATFMQLFFTGFLPSYFKEVLLLDVRSNGIFSALPYIAQATGRLMAGKLSDILLRWVSATTSVKIFEGLALGAPMCSLIVLGFLDCRQVVLAIVCILVFQFFIGMTSAGHHKAYVLMAPRFASSIGALGNTISMLAGVAVSYAAGAVTQGGTPSDWHNAMFMNAAVAAVGIILFTAFASGEEQPWAQMVDNDAKKKNQVVSSVTK